MAAERDEAGAAGPGLSGGAYGDMGGGGQMGDLPSGTAEVRTGLHSGRTDEEYSGIAFAGTEPQGTRERVTAKARDVAGTVKERASELGERARSATSGVASQARGLADRAQSELQNRGVLEKIRDNPLPALGIAFAVGFLLSGSSDRGTGKASRAKRELRNALVAGLSTGLAQGARGFLRQAGAPDGVINSLMENLPGMAGGASGGEYSEGGYRSGGSQGGSYRSGQGGGMRSGSMQGSMSGSTGRTTGGAGHRPPSHQENL